MSTFVVLGPSNEITELFTDEPGYPAPPPGAVQVSEEIGAQLRQHGFAGKQLVAGVLGDAPPPPPPLAAWRTATLAKARALRLPIMQVLDGMQASALVNATTIMVDLQPVALSIVIEDCKQGLRDLPGAVDLTPCTTREQMEYLVLQAYHAIVLAAPPEIKSAFDSLKP